MLDKDRNSLDKYLDEIGREKPLTDAEERELAVRIGGGDSRAVERLTKANLRFVVSVARKYQKMGVDMSDLISEGNLGLMKAASQYDGRSGVRFVSYASPIVHKFIERAVEEQGALYRVPKKEETKAEKKRSHPLSADAPLGGRENVNLLSVIENTDVMPADSVLDVDAAAQGIESVLAVLDGREREVMTLFFGIGGMKMTFAEIGERMGLKRERVRQIRDKALRKMSRAKNGAVLKSLMGR